MKTREEYNKFTIEELNEKLTETREEYSNLLVQKATHQLTNPLRLRVVRKEIARIKTFIHQHKLGINADIEKA